MMSVRVEARDLKSMAEKIGPKFESDLRRMSNELADETKDTLQGYLRSYVPVATGALKRSIRTVKLEKTKWQIEMGEGLDRPYAHYQAFGYSPHAIYGPWMHVKAGESQPKKFVWVKKFTPFVHYSVMATGAWLDNAINSKVSGLRV